MPCPTCGKKYGILSAFNGKMREYMCNRCFKTVKTCDECNPMAHINCKPGYGIRPRLGGISTVKAQYDDENGVRRTCERRIIFRRPELHF